MLVGGALSPRAGGGLQLEERRHLALDRAGIGAAEAELELRAALLLPGRHAALAAQLTVGEAVDVVRVGAHGRVKVHGRVLAELEGLEAVDDERLRQGALRAQALVEEQTVAAEAFDLAQHGGGRDAEVAGDLAVGGAGEQAQEELARQVGPAQPVGQREGL